MANLGHNFLRRAERLLTPLLSGGISVNFLVKDDFLADDAAPVTSPRTCEPGPGILQLTQTSNTLAVASREMIGVGAPVGTNDPGFYARQFDRVVGRCARMRLRSDSAFGTDVNKMISPRAVWSESNISAPGLNISYGLFWWSDARFHVIHGSGSVATPSLIDPLAHDTFYDISLIHRDPGTFIAIGNKLAWVGIRSSASPLYLNAGSGSTNRYPGRFRTLRVADLGSPWNSAYGLATQRLAGARSVNDSFTSESDCHVDFTITTMPSAGAIQVDFRRQDANNCWRIEVTSAGAVNLREVVAGVPTTRLSTTATTGDRIVCIADGPEMILHRDRAGAETATGIYLVASNFQTQTGGIISSFGTGGAVSDLVLWPRNISGMAKAWLAAIAA